jgi:hypothetical protein
MTLSAQTVIFRCIDFLVQQLSYKKYGKFKLLLKILILYLFFTFCTHTYIFKAFFLKKKYSYSFLLV